MPTTTVKPTSVGPGSLFLKEHFSNLSAIARDSYSLSSLSVFAQRNVYLEGNLISMRGDRQFQADVIDNTARVVNTVKPAQIGLTTSTIVYFLSGMATQPPGKFNVVYALPSANDAQKLTVTKVDPIIQGSPYLRARLNKDVDNAELKEINGNFLFTRGTKSDTAALSISADCLVADEVDRCDPDKLKQFRSRLQASPLKIIKQFSTPTIDRYGISKEAEASRRMRHLGMCHSCGHKWLPTYHQDIVIPGYLGDLEDLTKYNIKDVRWQEAHWKCPKCGNDPKFTPETLEWVCENPEDQYEAITYYITPVTTCRILVPSYLVSTSTEFNTRTEWKNQVLGETGEENNEQLTIGDIESCTIDSPLDSSEVHFMGCDMGLTCHITIGRLTSAVMTANGKPSLLVVHRESVPIGQFNARRLELIKQYRCITSVHDVYPYTPTIMAITDSDPNAYGAVFTTSKSPEMYTVREKKQDLEEGKLNLRLVSINRTAVFDTLLDMFKKREIVIHKQANHDELVMHLMSLRRVQIFQGDELVFSWQKTDGNDHGFFSLMYMYLACTLRGTVSESRGSSFSLVSKFRVRKGVL